MLLYPKDYFKKVSDISYEYLVQNNIKGLILDVDNTLIDYYKNITQETIDWVKKLKEEKIKIHILSNSNHKKKVEEVAKKLGLEYIHWGMKPLKRGFKIVQKILNIPSENIAVVGDQIFTDIIGANRMHMYSILVEPINQKDIFLTWIKRPIENYIKNKYLEKTE